MNYFIKSKGALSEALVFISCVLIFLSSAVKPTESFFEGSDRYFTLTNSIVSSSSVLLLVISLIIMLLSVTNQYLVDFRVPRIGRATSIFLLMKVWAVAIYLMYGVFDVNLFFSFFVFLILSLYVLGRDVSRYDGFLICIKALSFFALIFCVLNFYEYFYNPASVLWKGRMYGITNHPNFLGGYCAVLLPFVLFYISDLKGWYKLLFVSVAISLILLVLMSGSRSSFFSMAMGLLCYGFLRGLGIRVVLIGVIIILASVPIFMLLIGFFEQDFNFDRLMWTENTRAYVNYELWNVFLDNPIWGNPIQSLSTSNSYLLAAARYGIIGIALISIVLVSVVVSSVRYWLSGVKELGVAYISAMVVILPYSLFEGVLIENYSFGQCVFVLCALFLGCKKTVYKEDSL